MNNLIENSKNNPPRKKIRKIKEKKGLQNIIGNELKRSSSSTQIISFLSPGFISSKILRCQILHSFLNDTFGTDPFTIEDIFENMPIDLYFKIIGSPNTPKILLQFPMLRFILLKFFPKRILDSMSFSESRPILIGLLDKLRKDVYVIQYISEGVYLLRSSLILSNMQISIPTFFNIPNSIELFWCFIEISSIIENNDNDSSVLWLKRWSLKEAIMNVKPNNSMVYKFIQKVGYQNSRSVRQVEKLVSKYGFDPIFFQDFLPLESSDICEEDENIHNFCVNFQWENTSIQTYLPQEIQAQYDIDKNYIFIDLVAKSRITTGGIITSSPIKWNKIYKILESNELLVRHDIYNYFRYLFTTFETFQSKFYFTSALTIAQSFDKKEEDQTEYLELTEKKLLSHFDITNLQLTVLDEIGELIEAFKRFLIFPSKYYIPSLGDSFFSEYIWSYSRESLIFLKLSGLYKQINSQKNLIKPSKQNHVELSLLKNIYFYNELTKLLEILTKAGINNPNKEIPIDFSDISSIYYVLHQDIFVDAANYHLVDFVIEKDENEIEFNLKSISKFKSYLCHLDTIKKMLKLRFNRIPFPHLPSLSVEIEKTSKNEIVKKKPKLLRKCDMKINQNLNYIFDAFHEFSLILSQALHFQNQSLHLYACYSYGFIIHSQYDGLDLNTLRKIFDLPFESSLFDELLCSLEFLEEFYFIRKKSSSSALPIYVSDAYFLHKEKEHYWTNICHQVDEQVLIKQCTIVCEIVELNPGIEIFELFKKIAYLSISDLLQIINVLIYDEAIYMTTFITSDENSLFEDTVDIPITNLSSDHILVLFYLFQVDPSCNLPIIKLFPTTNAAMNNQCLP